MFDLAGKIAVVTGGSRGIGRAVSIALAGAGAHVLVNYRSNEEAAKETLRLIEEAGGTGEALGFDVADPESVDTAIKEAAKRLGHIDVRVGDQTFRRYLFTYTTPGAAGRSVLESFEECAGPPASSSSSRKSCPASPSADRTSSESESDSFSRS